MSTFVKAAVLGLGLMAGAAFAAQAQTSETLSSLPPGGGPTASQVAPSGAYPGPGPGGGNAAVAPHFQKPAGYDADVAMHPYERGIGPRPN